MTNTTKISLEGLEALHKRGETLPDREDAPEIDMPDGFWDDAEIVDRHNKKSVHLRVDPEIYEFFKEGGKGHLTRMNAVLRSYVDAKKNRHTPS